MEALVTDPRVDAVIVASPNSMHVEPTLTAARAGKAIFVEKPIALNYADCASMVDTARANNVFFMAGHVMNFMNGVRLAKRLIASGELGRVLHIRSTRTGWEAEPPIAAWKNVRGLSGGHLYHHIHELDCVQSILGPARFATMIGGNMAHHGVDDVEDMLLIQLQFDDAFATLEYGSAFRWPEHYLLIQAEKGAVKIDLQDVGVTVRIGDAEEHHLLHRTEEEDRQRAEIYAGLTTTDGGDGGDCDGGRLHPLAQGEPQGGDSGDHSLGAEVSRRRNCATMTCDPAPTGVRPRQCRGRTPASRRILSR